MSRTRKRKVRKTVRIYHGPPENPLAMYWSVPVTDARRGVTINGTLAAAMRAHRGMTIGCALSETCRDSAKQFPHPVFLGYVTKSTALIVDKLNKQGHPAHAMRYGHSYGKIVDMNDDGTLKKRIKDDPALVERPFNLRPPRKRPTGPHHAHAAPRTHATPVPHVSATLKGAMARAVNAGRINQQAARQIARAVKEGAKSDAHEPETMKA